MLLKSQDNAPDKPLIFVVLGLVIFGILMVFDASVADATKTFGDKFFYVKRQLLWAGIGMVLFFVFSKIKYTFWEKIALPLLLFNILLLLIILIPGVGVTALGAARRIDIGPIAIQPAELIKLTLTLYLAKVLSKNPSILRFLVPVVIISGLIVAEPDLGTASVVIFTAFLIYFASGANIFVFLSMAGAGILGVLFLAITSNYRKERILTFLNPAHDPLDTSYHVRQVLIALGSGGLFGRGLGNSRQKYLFLPEPATDSIFAIIGEELGFLGASIVFLTFVFLVVKGFQIARRLADPFARLVAVGIVGFLGIQTIINIGAMVAIIPLTGIPLPLVSYGGSSLTVTLAALGILVNISKYQKKEGKKR